MEDKTIFGEHNFKATHLDMGRILPFFPWKELFEKRHFELPYPAVIHTDDEAETLYRSVVDMLVGLMTDNTVDIDVDLTFEGNPEDTASARGTLIINVDFKEKPDRECEKSNITPEELANYLRLAALDWVMNEENYGSILKAEPKAANRWLITTVTSR
ncbi:hypothetical protein [Porphyromonas macacae]|uniref:Uncharacterized protein n=1 Tax=Porphyromonas macacae TaxID=28115 RepID=A0A379DGE9_9PORP|nr:hypothetical protein [Porphyromonas macacae]SUB77439.1 Uncharacterised protein [Porphyromonas macacae]